MCTPNLIANSGQEYAFLNEQVTDSFDYKRNNSLGRHILLDRAPD
jgi:hypothetical protein